MFTELDRRINSSRVKLQPILISLQKNLELPCRQAGMHHDISDDMPPREPLRTGNFTEGLKTLNFVAC